MYAWRAIFQTPTSDTRNSLCLSQLIMDSLSWGIYDHDDIRKEDARHRKITLANLERKHILQNDLSSVWWITYPSI
jgi:hypothetical protein